MASNSDIIIGHLLKQVWLQNALEYLYVTFGSSLRASVEPVVATAAANRITNDGAIVQTSEVAGSSAAAVRFSGSAGSLVNNGTIAGMDFDGVRVVGTAAADETIIQNYGTITGRAAAIDIDSGRASLTNAGLIGGAIGVDSTGIEVGLTLVNTGTIIGGTSGVRLGALGFGANELRNAGTITGLRGTAVVGGDGIDVVVNSGLIDGGLALGGSGDAYDGRLGRLVGEVQGGDGNDILFGGAGDEALSGGDGDDEIDGGAGRDRLEGGAGADSLTGGDGNDTILGGAGADEIDGGAGFDVASFAGAAAGVLVDLLDATASLGEAEEDDLVGIEGAVGSAQADTLLGDAGANELRGLAGNDSLDGRGGFDTLRGGAGNDSYRVDAAQDRVFESAGNGNDTLRASVSFSLGFGSEVEVLATTSESGTGAINLAGSGTANALRGNAGANRLSGRAGADTLSGLGGNDWLDGGRDADRLDGADGADTLTGGAGGDILSGGGGADLFTLDSLAALFDTIQDFSTVDDTIRLPKAVFTALPSGALAAGAFTSGPTLAWTTTSQRLHYNTATGHLTYDPDGSGALPGTLCGLLANVPAGVGAADFLVA